MNILLWILQAGLAFYNITGGLYMINNYEKLASPWALNSLMQPVWIILGVLQILFALGLVLPAFMKSLRNTVSVSAAGLAVISLSGTLLYSAYSGFPGMLWGVIPAVLAAFVAYGRAKK